MSQPSSGTQANLPTSSVFHSNFSISALLSEPNELPEENPPASLPRNESENASTAEQFNEPTIEEINESENLSTTEESSAGNTSSRNRMLPVTRPPYTYASLILMAIRNSPENRLTLSSICDWIAENFPFYRRHDKSWQNSIRHSLSLNKYFVKVNRSSDDRGRGHYWTLDSSAADLTIGESTGRVRSTNNTFSNPSYPAAAFRPIPPFHYTTRYHHHPYIHPMPTGMPNGGHIIPNATYLPSTRETMSIQQMAAIQNQRPLSTHHLMQQFQQSYYMP